jgi:hypothetical protein
MLFVLFVVYAVRGAPYMEIVIADTYKERKNVEAYCAYWERIECKECLAWRRRNVVNGGYVVYCVNVVNGGYVA